MRIILLSGGSGKRLWPLSNNSRSKQFLKVLKDPNGDAESMVQRVYRQIREICPEASITIATNAAQIDSIRSQLGSAVDVVVEPERRNTYPAIVLASAYLYHSKNCSPDEPVIIMPVDPYAERGYFETLSRMERAVNEDAADIVLMGIDPTYPSEKYGYIVPDKSTSDGYTKVSRFVEKPDLETAQRLIDEGALWNAGVFALKLGYIIDKLQPDIKDRPLEDIRAHYGDMKKNSFDYEVVEKVGSIAMVPYKGMWKDLGTWNTMSEEIDTDIGMVVRGRGTENTQVINELDIPAVVMGAKDMVVAISPDGILVTGKEESSYIKPYIDELEQRPMYEERRWGTYKVIDFITYSDGQKSLTKHLRLMAGKKLSYQSHEKRDEIWTIVDGTGILLLDGHTRNVKRGDVAYITAGMKHALCAVTDLHLIEVQIGQELTEEDITRYAMDWQA